MGSPGVSGPELASAITASGLSIYEPLVDKPDLFWDIAILEDHLRTRLVGLTLAYPLRTRSKVIKAAVCRALGYPVPKAFRRIRPRFPGQDLDVYVQKADNLQIWNEEVSPTRRYALIRVNYHDEITDVRVVTGEALARLDRTGTLTRKYQGRRRPGRVGSKLVSTRDTARLTRVLHPAKTLPTHILAGMSPTARPERGHVLTIDAIVTAHVGMLGLW
jgi:hypothetical protein